MESRLRFAVILSSLILLGELVGGFLSNSLALLSDAGHVFADVLALSLSWFGIKQSQKPATSGMTYGFHRLGILIALFNALTILVVSAIIAFEAYHRLRSPEPVHSSLMLGVAVIGLVANLIVVSRLEGYSRRSLNVRSAFLHALGDALASVGVILGAIIISLSGWLWVDPIVSVFIALLVAYSAWRIIREGVEIVLEATPRGISVDELVHAILEIPGVQSVHDLHVWSITPQIRALSAHVAVEDMPIPERGGLLEQLNTLLRQRYNINHTTMQLDCKSCNVADLHCDLDSGDDESECHQH